MNLPGLSRPPGQPELIKQAAQQFNAINEATFVKMGPTIERASAAATSANVWQGKGATAFRQLTDVMGKNVDGLANAFGSANGQLHTYAYFLSEAQAKWDAADRKQQQLQEEINSLHGRISTDNAQNEVATQAHRAAVSEAKAANQPTPPVPHLTNTAALTTRVADLQSQIDYLAEPKSEAVENMKMHTQYLQESLHSTASTNAFSSGGNIWVEVLIGSVAIAAIPLAVAFAPEIISGGALLLGAGADAVSGIGSVAIGVGSELISDIGSVGLVTALQTNAGMWMAGAGAATGAGAVSLTAEDLLQENSAVVDEVASSEIGAVSDAADGIATDANTSLDTVANSRWSTVMKQNPASVSSSINNRIRESRGIGRMVVSVVQGSGGSHGASVAQINGNLEVTDQVSNVVFPSVEAWAQHLGFAPDATDLTWNLSDLAK